MSACGSLEEESRADEHALIRWKRPTKSSSEDCNRRNDLPPPMNSIWRRRWRWTQALSKAKRTLLVVALVSVICLQTLLLVADRTSLIGGSRLAGRADDEESVGVVNNPGYSGWSASRPEATTTPESEVNHTNPHPFKYVLSETSICGQLPDLFVLTVVHTHPSHYKRRMVIRETWGNQRYYQAGAKLKVLFMMGSTGKNQRLMQTVAIESQRYGDIVQEDFEDTYRNLTHKSVMWLKWVTRYCPDVTYVLKADDDMFVNVFNLINHLGHLSTKGIASNRSLLCLVWSQMPVMRNPHNKWYVSKSDHPNDHFVKYCSGSAYVLTGDLIEPMYRIALDTKFFWVDDVYTTGMLPEALGNVHHYNLGSLYTLREADAYHKITHGRAVFAHVPGSLNTRYRIWKNILRARGLG